MMCSSLTPVTFIGRSRRRTPARRTHDPADGIEHRQRHTEPRRPRADRRRRRREHLPHGHEAFGDDVALTVASALGGEQECLRHVFDTDDFGADALDVYRHLSQRRRLHHQALMRLPVEWSVGIGHAHRDGGQLLGAGILQHQIFGLAARLDIGAANALPVERHVLRCGFAVLGDGDRADRAAEHELVQVRLDRDVQHATQALDVRLEQRRRIAKVEAGVDDAVEHHVPIGHGRAQRHVVAQIAVGAFDVEVVDGHRAAGLAQIHPHVVTALDQLSRDV